MRVKAFIGECDQNLNDNQKYNLFLKHYLSKNRGTTQQDFIKYQIDYFNKSINEINNFDYQPKKEQLIKIAKSFLDKPQQIEDYVNKGIEKLKRSKSNQIKDFESLILDYKIKYEVITGKGFEVVQKNNKKKKDCEYYWHKIGVSFATGEMDKLIEKFNGSFNSIAVHLGNKNYEKFILASKNDYKKTNTEKNIYYSRKKMQSVIDYCKQKKLIIQQDFINRLPLE